MKPKYRRIAKTIPAIVTLVMSSAAVSNAALVADGPDSSVTITATVNDGGNHVFANNSGDGSNTTVNILTGATLTGTAGQTAVVETTGAAYVITNDGSITSPILNDDGIRVSGGTGTVINNNATGIISSATEDAIEINIDGVTVNNAAGGLIQGGSSGGDTAIAAQNLLSVFNSGTIETTTNGGGDAINAGNGAIINNLAGGLIAGDSDGIDVNDGAIIFNAFSTDPLKGITGGANGILANDLLQLTNDGNITGTAGDGVQTGQNAQISNTGNITGGDDGIFAGFGLQLLSNTGAITGNGGDGVESGDNAEINNNATGVITGNDDGVDATDFLTLVNDGRIEGLGSDGVEANNNVTKITNNVSTDATTGTIIGFDDGIQVGNISLIENFGSITGTNGFGINAGTNLTLMNMLGGTITGTNGGGVFAGGVANINNAGTISAPLGLAVRVGGNSVVTNSGLITGDIGVDAVTALPFTLNNSGTITGTDVTNAGANPLAIDGGTNDDILNLDLGSQINGNIDLKAAVIGDTINLREGLSTPGGMSNVIQGNIFNVQNINKDLGGVAFINGNVQADNITINPLGGGLYINGNIIASDNASQSIITSNGAALGGTGVWNANVTINTGGISAGAIPINLDTNPLNSIGTVTVNGNVNHSPGSFIRFDVQPGPVGGPPGASDLIVMGPGGAYNVNGADVRISPTNVNTPITSGTYTIVNGGAGSVTGPLGSLGIQFNANIADNDTQGTLSGLAGQNVTNALLVTEFSTLSIVPNGAGQDLQLVINRDFTGIAGLTDSQFDFASALDASLGFNDAELQDFIAALDYSTLGDVLEFFDDITSVENSTFSTAAAIASSNFQTNRVVQNHLAMARSQTGNVSRTYVGSYAEPAPAPAPMALGNRFNAWGSVSYDWRDGQGIDGEEASFLAGIDYRIAPNFLMGILIEGSTADYDTAFGGSDVDTLRGAIYGTYGEATGIYADFLLGFGDHDFDSSFGPFNGNTDASSVQAMLTVGYAMQTGGVKHGPFGGIEYTNIDLDGYNVGGIVPISVGSYDVESTRLLIGYRAEAEYGRFTPYASVAYAHELEDGNQGTTGTIIPTGATFGITGGSLDSAFLISVGTGYSFSESLSMNVGYNGEIATDNGVDSHGATVGLNYAF